MNARERHNRVLTFQSADRIPFEPGGPRESTVTTWRTQGLGPQANWWEAMCEAIGIDAPSPPWQSVPADFRLIPQFEEKILAHHDGHYEIQDWQGNVVEVSDEFDPTYLRGGRELVTRRWIRTPVQTRDDWEAIKGRYDLDAPGRFAEDFAQQCTGLTGRDWPMRLYFSGVFWQLRDWVGFEQLCMLTIDDPDWVAEMARFWTDFVAGMLQRIFQHVTPDRLFIMEDMAYKEKAMISPAMTRQFCMPAWQCWSDLAGKAGVRVIEIDSDGYVGELIPLWIESGINCTSPLEVAAGNDIVALREQFGRDIAFRMGVDKRAMAKGGDVIAAELKRIEPVVVGGGYVPECDHGIPKDVSWPNFLHYARLLAEMTGWL